VVSWLDGIDTRGHNWDQANWIVISLESQKNNKSVYPQLKPTET
jgi:allantoicase